MENKAKILYVDDEEGARELIATGLGERGYKVITAVSGEDGLEKIKANELDIVLLDIMLPGMDGIATLEEIRKIKPEIDTIIVTGHSSLESAIDSLKKGAVDYIEKPIVFTKLIGAIERAMEQRNLRETVLLYEISKVVFSTIELDSLLKIIVDLTMKVLRADDVSVMLFGEKQQLYIAISSGLSKDVQKKTRLAIGDRIAGWVAQHKEPVILIDGLGHDSRFADISGREEIKSSMVIPLAGDHGAIGVLNANRMHISENFNQNDLYKARIFVSLVTLALENANLYARLKSSGEKLAKNNEELAQKEKIAVDRLAEAKKAHEELQAAQSQLIQAEKLSSLGRLVSEMAHEVNNPLMIIYGNAQLCLMQKIQDEEVKNNLKIILEETGRAKEIIQRLLKFSRPAKGDLKKIDIKNVIESVARIVAHQFSLSNVRIEKKYARDLPLLLADEKQIEEVCMNILNNARDAMSNGGIIEISVSQEGNYVRTDFRDTGCGMSETIKAKLFEPFFTTKEKGVGLGLSVCYGIVKAHKGKLDIQSQPQKGTTATIFLPTGEE